MAEAPTTFQVIHTSTNRASSALRFKIISYSLGDCCCANPLHFKWHFSCTPLCKYQWEVETLTWLKNLVFLFSLFYLFPLISSRFVLFLSWGRALFTCIMRPQWVPQCSILLASQPDKSQWQSSSVFSTGGIMRIDPLVWLAQLKVGKRINITMTSCL